MMPFYDLLPFPYGYGPHLDLPSFPTRRSSDLRVGVEVEQDARGDALVLAHQAEQDVLGADVVVAQRQRLAQREALSDRKSTRLNSSHTVISYAVFCLKKKKQAADYVSCGSHHL